MKTGNLNELFKGNTSNLLKLDNAKFGADIVFLSDKIKDCKGILFYITNDELQAKEAFELVKFYQKDLNAVLLSSWDTAPYERFSPKKYIMAKRVDSLLEIASFDGSNPLIVVTSLSAIMQKVPPKDVFKKLNYELKLNVKISLNDLAERLTANGFSRVDVVIEQGDFAVRGGILDVFLAHELEPIRIDFFGDEIDSIKYFNPLTQRSTSSLNKININAVGEVFLNDDTISEFRKNWRDLQGFEGLRHEFYEAISKKISFQGWEQWLPLFYKNTVTVFDYIKHDSLFITFRDEFMENIKNKTSMINSYYLDKKEVMGINPVIPNSFYVLYDEWLEIINSGKIIISNIFSTSEERKTNSSTGGDTVISIDSLSIENFSFEKNIASDNYWQDFKKYLLNLNRDTVIACYSDESIIKLRKLFKDYSVGIIEKIDNFSDTLSKSNKKKKDFVYYTTILDFRKGFSLPDFALITEGEIIGEHTFKYKKRVVKAENVIFDVASLVKDDLVVHVEHGIGKFIGIKTLEVIGLKQDYLELVYFGDNKLFVPIANLDLISRYGNDSDNVVLDKLGTLHWQNRKARLKNRIREIADYLIKNAANRLLAKKEPILLPESEYQEFAARFVWQETEDQSKAINDVINDLASDHPSDRLICGDVGFGKTEVAMRAAFIAAMAGRQTAVLVPTTLLARQHYLNFKNRFADFAINVKQLSRLITAKEAKSVKEGIKDGTVDIVIGTHALLAKDIEFKNLELLIVDEEQHFGVTHKEKLKELKDNITVITLSATPIPRTMQLAMSGVREMSIIATPPVDRLSVSTFIMRFDDLTIRDAILREKNRGGQTFIVVPHIKDISPMLDTLKNILPDIKIIIANGQMPARQLENAIDSFQNAHGDLLLSTPIIESGIDLPKANTIIIHNAHKFGLSQLYQLRGRVGRSRVKGFAYLTFPDKIKFNPLAMKRLEIMQSLEGLGAGFQLASYDLDLRGAGNLLGDEQSGHIREVGIELYQQMLQDAVTLAKAELLEAKKGNNKREKPINITSSKIEKGVVVDDYNNAFGEEIVDDDFSPQINLGFETRIPETYIDDINLRINLYRRLSSLKDVESIQDFVDELQDRFGTPPKSVIYLTELIKIRNLAKAVKIIKLDIVSNGIVIVFKNGNFGNLEGLIRLIQSRKNSTIKPDSSVFFSFNSSNKAEDMDDIVKINMIKDLLKEIISTIKL